MFTGIVEEIGTVRALRAGTTARIEVACATVREGLGVGDSVSVNGCCVTVATLADGGFEADLMGETLRRTTLGDLAAGDPVNLERAVRVDGRLGGHVVQGHVDAVTDVIAVEPQGEWTVMGFALPPALAPYVVEKGSVTIDGCSLTVIGVEEARGVWERRRLGRRASADPVTAPGGFRVGLIPHTLAVTVFGGRREGDRVNVEVDIVAKYVERMLAAGVASPYSAGTQARQEQ